jgi:hypothetical protein
MGQGENSFAPLRGIFQKQSQPLPRCNITLLRPSDTGGSRHLCHVATLAGLAGIAKLRIHDVPTAAFRYRSMPVCGPAKRLDLARRRCRGCSSLVVTVDDVFYFQ